MKTMKPKHLATLAVTLFLSAILSVTNAQDQKKSFKVNKGDLLDVSSRMGNITIDTWDKNEINVIVKNTFFQLRNTLTASRQSVVSMILVWLSCSWRP